jgi:hypothetical protein
MGRTGESGAVDVSVLLAFVAAFLLPLQVNGQGDRVRIVTVSQRTTVLLVMPGVDGGPEFLIRMTPLLKEVPTLVFMVTGRVQHVSGLVPDTDYNVSARSVRERVEGPPGPATRVTTLPDKPGGPPQNIRVINAGQTHITITWDPPLPTEINDRQGIIAYRIVFNNKDIGKTPNLHYTFNNLLPGCSHEVEIYPINDQGEGDVAGVVTVETLPLPDHTSTGASSIAWPV